ncbi:MAG: hypothetical protein RL122_2752 [Pseudomonadota bacterium]|jgi:hypothetical protein|uniref:Uncharacterized protein n=1 Tax=Thiothrix fructosivorans TaxID=111770 RepID=A0A8B0SCY7_9GAMM|nr:hypothetical protein [Thiothrix fructosivorans]MBO0614373.1 hypothetical protein [Thiothrix fructosivorans]QTX09216.1 hypothetical protein J1836_011220 [Thiothrix fructosivorans]
MSVIPLFADPGGMAMPLVFLPEFLTAILTPEFVLAGEEFFVPSAADGHDISAAAAWAADATLFQPIKLMDL